MTKEKIIFFGNGPLADYVLEVLKPSCDIIFHAREKADLEQVKELKKADQTGAIHGVLASFGVIIKQDVLDLFEPEGILNIHPSLLPDLRGPSPIETAILRGDQVFYGSVMKLVKEMDAGPVFCQFKTPKLISPFYACPEDKEVIYSMLAHLGADWVVKHLSNLPTPIPQPKTGITFCQKLDKSMSQLDPKHKSATTLLCEIRAFSKFPKSKYTFYGHDCIIHAAHIADHPLFPEGPEELSLKCADGETLYIDYLQPADRKIMDAKSFLNGYVK